MKPSHRDMRFQPEISCRGLTRRTIFQVAALCLLAAFLLQWRSGAWTADLDSDDDEPAHAVSALMVHDYLAQGLPGKPVAFAENFASHYRKVAIGHWPPLFYVTEGAWTLVAGRTRVGLLSWVAVCGGGLLLSVFVLARRTASLFVACAATGFLCWSPLFRELIYAVRPDLLMATLVLWAAAFAAEAFRTGDRRPGFLALLLTLLAGLVHGRSMLLLLMPLCLLLLNFQTFHACRWRRGWTVLALRGLLLVLIPRFFAPHEAIRWSFFPAMGSTVLRLAGWPLLLSLAGAALALRERGLRDPLYGGMTALVLSGVLFHTLMPGPWVHYYLISVLPALAILAAAGLESVLHRRWTSTRERVAWLVLTGCMAASVLCATKKPSCGFRQEIARGLLNGHSHALVSGWPVIEGGLTVEAALVDPALHRTIDRGSKVLSDSTWAGKGYRLLYHSPQEVLDALDAKHITLVVVEDNGSLPAAVQLLQAMRMDASRWERVPIGVKGTEAFCRRGQETTLLERSAVVEGAG